MMKLFQIGEISKMQNVLSTLTEQGTNWGISIVKALLILFIGRYVIKLINKLIKRILDKQGIAPAVKTFVGSLINILLMVLLLVSVIGALGVQTSSFAALIASAGVAVGMALSGNLSNFAGGLIILLFKPFKIGDFINGSGVSGTVMEIQIFHTIVNTLDNVRVYIPNGALSSGNINNYSVDKRMVEWTFGVSYGEDFEKVRKVILDVLAQDDRIFTEPAPLVEMKELADSSVNILVRVWTKGSDYWGVTFKINKEIYAKFNELGIEFPFPQLTIHQEN